MKRLLSLGVLLVLVTTTAQAQQSTVRLRGSIVSLDGNALTVNALGTNSKVTLAEGFRVNLFVKSDLSKVIEGSYIGTAAEPQPDGSLKALGVVIFPEALRGGGEGFRPYDLTPQSTMTNATVSSVTPAMVEKVQGRILLLKYKDGEKRVVVLPDTPVGTFLPGDRSALVAGAHVVLTATKQPDGSLTAAGVSVGKDGFTPPN